MSIYKDLMKAGQSMTDIDKMDALFYVKMLLYKDPKQQVYIEDIL